MIPPMSGCFVHVMRVRGITPAGSSRSNLWSVTADPRTMPGLMGYCSARQFSATSSSTVSLSHRHATRVTNSLGLKVGMLKSISSWPVKK
jgi:hypothetical protein